MLWMINDKNNKLMLLYPEYIQQDPSSPENTIKLDIF